MTNSTSEKEMQKVNLQNKKILLGISGSIAAYKSALLTRLLIKSGAQVRIIITHDAKEFIAPLTLSTLSKHPVYSSFYQDKEQGVWVNHVELGLWADCMLIAPATANTISKMAHGAADNLLVATYLSARCPVLIAPAMDLDMFTHPTTFRNLNQLTADGVRIIDAETGELASGLHGKGRMAEPENIIEALQTFFSKKKHDFSGQIVTISAGPTREDIDVIRFISNHSSGTMGVELANAFAHAGAKVHLVLGPTSKQFQFHKNIEVHRVVSAADMHHEVSRHFANSNITIMAAAVADYTPKTTFSHKLKKKDTDLSLNLVRTTDILASLGESKKSNQLLIGFAVETDDEIENATRKLEKKNLDFIVLNSLNDKGAGFKHLSNKVTIIDKYNKIHKFELKSKAEVAQDILETIKTFSYEV